MNFFYVGSYDEKIDNGINLPSGFRSELLCHYIMKTVVCKEETNY